MTRLMSFVGIAAVALVSGLSMQTSSLAQQFMEVYPIVETYPFSGQIIYATPNQLIGFDSQTGAPITSNMEINGSAFSPGRTQSMNNGSMRPIQRPVCDQSGGHGTRTHNPLRGTTFPVWPLAIRLPSGFSKACKSLSDDIQIRDSGKRDLVLWTVPRNSKELGFVSKPM